jgi:hypothetical protein
MDETASEMSIHYSSKQCKKTLEQKTFSYNRIETKCIGKKRKKKFKIV